MEKALIHTSRTLLALYFIYPGATKLLTPEGSLALMELHNIPMAIVLLPIAGIVQVAAGLCLLINKQVVVSALTLAAMVLVINVGLHDFWNTYEGVNTGHEMQNFVKNLGIFSGLLLLAAANLATSKQSVAD